MRGGGDDDDDGDDENFQGGGMIYHRDQKKVGDHPTLRTRWFCQLGEKYEPLLAKHSRNVLLGTGITLRCGRCV